MQVKTFVINPLCSEQAEEEANRFVRSHRVLQLDRQYDSAGGCWVLLATYQEGDALHDVQPQQRQPKKDYRELLPEEAFARFARYRDIRREVSQQQGVPPYVVFTDEELAKLAEHEQLTAALMQQIQGIGQQRVKKYGQYFLPESQPQQQAGQQPAGQPAQQQ